MRGRNNIASNNMKSNKNRLGIPDRDGGAGRLAQQQDEQLLERDNDKSLEDLASKVRMIKKVSEDIEIGITEGNRRLDDLDSDMSGVQGLLKNTMGKLNELTRSGGSRHMCYLILFIVFVFLLVYYIITRTRKSTAPEV
eukprot:TRINITY_DN4976_c0_g1_i2.p1 TRINITY_DN4976_c0_g1~~TRINITY_DN4976_c0_g1_i2.p1  ORF type:complete len:139 (-),score=24.34 TRINITY_DN4976_c0_g1_i2:16-432(-)